MSLRKCGLYAGSATFNSYLCNFRRGEFLLHFPDMPNDKRAELMRYWAQFAG
jgi:hypothetical protein